jgi:4-hydroxy-tetrahydrodipicolinate reductase
MDERNAGGSPAGRPVKVIIWGLGAMGRLMTAMVVADPGLHLVASVSRRASGAGTVDTADMVGLKRPTGAPVLGSLGAALERSGGADVVLHGTSSFVREVAGEIETCLDHRLNVVTIAEEMAYPWAGEPALAQRLHESAVARGRTILGTGVNPGFVLDTLIAVLSSATAHVESVYASRVNDLSPFGPTVMRTQGVGLAPDEFSRRVADGTVVGHIGFPESMHLIARALGVELSRVEQSREPIISSVRRETPHVVVEPGFVAGCRHTARGFSGDRVVIELDHPQQVRPEAEGVATGDYIRLKGIPDIEMRTSPEIPGGLATAALAVNMIHPVVEGAPGLLTMLDFPVPRGSARRNVELIADVR